jgi:hypothetical protein
MNLKTEDFVITPPAGGQRELTRYSRAKSIVRHLLSLPLSAAMRVHQYRNLHSATVYAALCQLDSCDQS